MQPLFRRLIGADEGMDMVEYALLVAFIAMVSVAILSTLGSSIGEALDNADTQLRSDGGV